MRLLLIATVLAAAAGCGGFAREPNWRNAESATADWRVPAPDYVHSVSTPIRFEDIPDYVEEMTDDGWEFVSYEEAAPEFPSCYLVVFRRFR